MTELEDRQLREYRKYLRISSKRYLYTFRQAAFQLNCGESEFKISFIDTGKLKPVVIRDKFFIADSDIQKMIGECETFISRKAL